MEINYHVIADSEIIGIGPLMTKMDARSPEFAMFNAKTLFFYVHCKQQSILIESRLYYVGKGNEVGAQEQIERAAYKEFEDLYTETREQIKLLVSIK